jgi:hypothetical protein
MGSHAFLLALDCDPASYSSSVATMPRLFFEVASWFFFFSAQEL